MPNTSMTPPEVARRLRVSPEKIIGWIRRGQLVAVNVSNGRRPRFVIRLDDLLRFEQTRLVGGPRPAPRRRDNGGDTIEFF